LTKMHQFPCMSTSKTCTQAAFGMTHACQHPMVTFQISNEQMMLGLRDT